MRVEIELTHDDNQDIAALVVENLKPLLSSNGSRENDVIFDVPGLAAYLKVSTKWIYERTHLNEIPYFKIGGHLRFKKSTIDKWLKSYHVPAVNGR